eukprot:scaffold7358_cov252-Pinguiococcus_pyrenoidosus.AAC.6
MTQSKTIPARYVGMSLGLCASRARRLVQATAKKAKTAQIPTLTRNRILRTSSGCASELSTVATGTKERPSKLPQTKLSPVLKDLGAAARRATATAWLTFTTTVSFTSRTIACQAESATVAANAATSCHPWRHFCRDLSRRSRQARPSASACPSFRSNSTESATAVATPSRSRAGLAAGGDSTATASTNWRIPSIVGGLWRNANWSATAISSHTSSQTPRHIVSASAADYAVGIAFSLPLWRWDDAVGYFVVLLSKSIG